MMENQKTQKVDRQLSQEEIQKIFAFTSKKYIKYYDVQVELVDHIAHQIEDLQEEDSKLSFDNALHKVYKSFGIYGFTKVQETKMFELQKYWRKKIISYYLMYFKLPKILLTAGLAFLIYFLLSHLTQYFVASHIVSAAMVLIMVFSATFSYMNSKKRREHMPNKKLLLIESYESTIVTWSITGTGLMPLWINFPGFSDLELIQSDLIIFAFVFSLMIISFHASIYVFPRWLTTELEEKYNWMGLELGQA